jgi:hypothetical protein
MSTQRHSCMRWTGSAVSLLLCSAVASLVVPGAVTGLAFSISSAAWTQEQWTQHCTSIRTSYNPHKPFVTDRLTLAIENPRFLDFLYWVWANKITEHQVEQVGGTEWSGPSNGVIFHWAPGSRWETHTIVPFEHAIHHLTAEHHWQDNMFPDFFEKFGPIKRVGIGARLSMDQPPTWTQFLAHIGGPESPYYRYIFHQESSIDPTRRVVTLVGGQGVAFEYSFERYLQEIKEVLTDCIAYQFFELYDRYGPGFASRFGWAGQRIPTAR